MLILTFFVLIAIMIIFFISNNQFSTLSQVEDIIRTVFSNVSVVFSNSRITIFKGDRSGENFLLAVSNYFSPFNQQDILTLYKKAESLHIHKRILISDFALDERIISKKKLKEYEIEIWDSMKLFKLDNSFDEAINSYDKSPLSTSDTSDDTCKIENDSFDPIQDGTFNTHSIFSIFNNKTDRL